MAEMIEYIVERTMNNPYNQVFFYVIISLFTLTLLNLIWQYYTVRRQTKKGLRYVANVHLENIHEQFQAVAARFRQNNFFADLWREFDETLRKISIKGKTYYYNTVEFSYFFNEETLYHNKFRSSFWFSVPTLLTGIGILGTFFGLVIGLEPFEYVDFDSQQNIKTATESLLSGIGTSFLSSLWGISFSLLLNASSAIIKDLSIARIKRFTEHIEAIFPRHLSAEGEGLFEIKSELEKQTTALETFSTKLANAVMEGVDSSISRRLEPAIDKMTTVMEKFASENTESIGKNLEEIFSKFQNEISGAAKSETERLLNVTYSAAESISSSKQAFEQIMEKMDATLKNQQEFAKLNADEMESMVHHLETLNASAAKMDHLTQSQSKLVESAGDMVESTEKMRAIMVELGEILNSSREQATIYKASAQDLKEFSSSIQATLQQSEHLFTLQKETISELLPAVEQTANIIREIQAPLEQLRKIVAGIRMVEGVKLETYQKIDNFTTRVDQLVSALDGHQRSINDMLTNFDNTSKSAYRIWRDFESAFNQLGDKLDEGIVAYTERITSKTNEVFKFYDESMATGINRLKEGINFIAEKTEEIEEMLSQKDTPVS
ncbi:MAG: anti-phage defense ZorAB system ZorA [Deltaproteobacteria bacterium]|nr:anti-phage defense ZorAB system ZorA [Deltaproteobacteria bacterium]